MSFQFTEAQRDKLIPLIDAAEAAYQTNRTGVGIWTAAYQKIYEFITDETLLDDPVAGVDYYVWR